MADRNIGSWIKEKLNPAQPSIASLEPFASPETIVDFEQAYREIEVVHRSVDMIVNAMTEIPFIIDGGAAKKVNSSGTTSTPAETTATSKTSGAPAMTFDKTSHDFGTINEGDKVTTTFGFTNTGDADLIIVDARGSCGCTVPQYPKNKAIAPGETGSIVVSFDSSNKPGIQQKSVTISANTASGREMLRIKSDVTPDPVKQQQREAQARARQQN